MCFGFGVLPDSEKQKIDKKINGGFDMRKLINSIIAIFKNNNLREIKQEDIYKVCTAANEELSDYCRIEGFSGR